MPDGEQTLAPRARSEVTLRKQEPREQEQGPPHSLLKPNGHERQRSRLPSLVRRRKQRSKRSVKLAKRDPLVETGYSPGHEFRKGAAGLIRARLRSVFVARLDPHPDSTDSTPVCSMRSARFWCRARSEIQSQLYFGRRVHRGPSLMSFRNAGIEWGKPRSENCCAFWDTAARAKSGGPAASGQECAV